jgi:hypothetical protein
MAAQDAELHGALLAARAARNPCLGPEQRWDDVMSCRPALMHLVNDRGLSAAVIGVHGARAAGSLGAHAQQWAICLRVAGTERRLRME